jgi:hypothetical protein
MMKGKVTCFVCGHRTLEERCDWEICPVCFWEDDVLVSTTDRSSPANHGMMVSEAQANYMQYGAVSREFIANVRSPRPDEELDEGWAPLPESHELLAARKGGH